MGVSYLAWLKKSPQNWDDVEGILATDTSKPIRRGTIPQKSVEKNEKFRSDILLRLHEFGKKNQNQQFYCKSKQ